MEARTKNIQPPVVLIVEDELFLRSDLADCFRDAGFVVLEVARAEEAMVFCRDKTTVQALITDIQLNGSGSGWDVANAFRGQLLSLPVIYTSGDANDRTRAVSDSVFFNKPYHPEEVVKACQRLCRFWDTA